MPVGFDQVREMAMALPGVTEGVAMGTPAFYVRKLFFMRLKEDGETLVLRINLFEREYLLQAEPDAYFVTDHYREYPVVLARLPALSVERLRPRIEDAWRMRAPKRLADEYDRRASA
ncbi:MAG TPA: MmcQ/YjbR family DNA-binding protein [Longimicrobium sp.]